MPEDGDPRWQDTGGNYCRLVQGAGWALMPVERGPDWHGFSSWGTWTHLGGGSHSDVARMTWTQRHLIPWHRRAIKEREQFKRLVGAHLTKHRAT